MMVTTLRRSVTFSRATIGALLALLLLGFTVFYGLREAGSPGGGGPTVSGYLEASTLSGKAQITIGVYVDRPLLGYRESTGELTGFDVEIARYLAHSLGFADDQIVFSPVTPEERAIALATGKVDLVVAEFAITEERQKAVRFAAPYLVATQEALVPSALADDVRELGDLRGRRVCVTGGSTSESQLQRLDIPVATRGTTQSCVDGLTNGQFDAFVASSVLLASVRYGSEDKLSLVDLPLDTTELLGIGLPLGDIHLQALIEHFLQSSYLKRQNSPWQVAYDRTLGRAGLVATQPSVMSSVNLYDDLDPQALAGSRSPHRVPRHASVPPARQSTRRRSRLPRQRRAVPRQRRTVLRLVPRDRATRPTPSDPPTDNRPGGTPTRGFDWQGPWPLIVGIPVTVSALHVWIQSGGNMQLTLLMLQNINPVSFFTTMVFAALWQLAMVPVLILAVGSLILRSADSPADEEALAARYAFARWTRRIPNYVRWISFALAAISWPVMYLAWCALALHSVALGPTREDRPARHRVLVSGAAVVALILLAPTLISALLLGEAFPIVVLAAPLLLLAFGVGRPIQRTAVPLFARGAALLALALAVIGLHGIVTTPILPLSVVAVAQPGQDAQERLVGGHILGVDERYTMVLPKRGGIEMLSNDQIRSQLTCLRVERERYDLTLLTVFLDQSLLDRLARDQRPALTSDPGCRPVLR